jgi:hypothetical protein
VKKPQFLFLIIVRGFSPSPFGPEYDLELVCASGPRMKRSASSVSAAELRRLLRVISKEPLVARV